MTVVLAALCMAVAAEPAAPTVPLAFSPYRVRVWLDFDAAAGLSPQARAAVTRDFAALVDRMVGRAWQMTVGPSPAGLPHGPLPLPEKMALLAPATDKVLWLRVGRERTGGGAAGPSVRASEYDAEYAQWGPATVVPVGLPTLLGRQLYEAAIDRFRPQLTVLGADAEGKAVCIVRGQALPHDGRPNPLLTPGVPFRVFRDVVKEKKRVGRQEMPWAYLVLRQPIENGTNVRCDIVAALRFPLPRRTRGSSPVTGLACRPSPDARLGLRFVTGKEGRPAVGFEITARPLDEPAEIKLGITDHRGRLTVDADRALLDPPAGTAAPVPPRLFQILVKDGRLTIASFPVVPAETPFPPVRLRTDPLYSEAAGRLVSIQEEVVDVVARRLLLGRQLDRFIEKEDVAKAKETAEKLNALPDAVAFQQRVADIRTDLDECAKAASGSGIGPAIQRLFSQTNNLLENPRLAASKTTVDIEMTPEPKS